MGLPPEPSDRRSSPWVPPRAVKLSFRNKLARGVWRCVYLLLFRHSPTYFGFWWRRFLIRCFGATIGRHSFVYPSTRIWAPWNLEMGDHSSLSFDVDCYCVDKIRIGDRVTVSQYSFLCTASHDFNDPAMPLITAPIIVENDAWICADALVGPGVQVGEGAVVGAKAAVFRNVEPWTVVGGNPAAFIKARQKPSKPS